jgi:cation diffusion facilitator CzcD-associated flavoprotein CzcO
MRPLKVAVIGGGPGAMFFCHSYNKQRRQQEEDGDPIQELQITCFEKQSSPGGVWRSTSSSSSSSSPNQGDTVTTDDTRIYDELWTNGPSAAIEFFDYTFQEHFGDEPVPMYFPRRDIHEYIVSRVTKGHPSFFEEFFQLNTEVIRVTFENQKFSLILQDTLTEETRCEFFDKCIWAGGENGMKYIPRSLRVLFPNSDTAGTATNGNSKTNKAPLLLHSTETSSIRQHVPGKTVLLIGGSYSAEDLALQCLKWGAEKVHVSTRDEASPVTWTSSWPGDKVQVHEGVAIKAVKEDYSIELEKVYWQWPNDYVPYEDDDRKEEGKTSKNEEDREEKKDEAATPPYDTSDSHGPPTLTGVNLVIFCTGYSANLSMFDQPLRPTNNTIPKWYMGNIPFESKLLNENWRMSDENPAYPLTGHVPPCQGRMIHGNFNHPDFHRGVFLPNPSMMYLCEHGSEAPLLSLDVHAWLFCSFVTGRVPMSSVEEMRAANEHQVIDQLGMPYLRLYMDEAYYNVLEELSAFWTPGHMSPNECPWWDCEDQFGKYQFSLLAKVMEEGKYPGKSLGSYESLNANGNALLGFSDCSYESRTERISDKENERQWRTFRDDIHFPSRCYSLYTKTRSRPLKKKWLDAVGDVSIRAGDV